MLGGADLRILQRGRKCYRPTQIRKPNQRDSQFTGSFIADRSRKLRLSAHGRTEKRQGTQ